MPQRVSAAVTDRSARGIAAAVSRLVTDGVLGPGERLPTVRALARVLGVSGSAARVEVLAGLLLSLIHI